MTTTANPLAALDRIACATSPRPASLQVGDRFTRVDRSRYTTSSGEKKHHVVEFLAEVLEITPQGFCWGLVEVLREENAPTEFTPRRATAGTTAWFGWDAAVTRGDSKKVS